MRQLSIAARPTAIEAASRYPPYLLAAGRLVRAVVSQRAGGLLVVVNMNPDQKCNFDCLYCEVRRSAQNRGRRMDVSVMSEELRAMLLRLDSGGAMAFKELAGAPSDLLKLKAVALSGDGEPALCPKFFEVVREIHRIRKAGEFPWFKLILVSNSSGLDSPSVRKGLDLFDAADEIWLKLDAGTPSFMKSINNTLVPLSQVLRNIRSLGRKRPVVIQSLFCGINGEGPGDREIDAYVRRLEELRKSGTRICLVHIYSVSRPPARSECTHLSLARLSEIARIVRERTGLMTEVY